MKNFIKIMLCAVLTLSMLASCAFLPLSNVGGDASSVESKPTSVTAERTFAVGDYGVNVSVKGDWAKTDAENFDLQLSSNKYGANLSVFVFYKVDLANGTTAEDMFDEQNDSLFESRQNVTTVSELKSETVGTKTVLAKTTSAEKNGNKNYYRTYLVDEKDSKVFVWIMINSMPSDMEKNTEYFDGIVKNVTVEG